MKTQKITLAIITVLAACIFQACNGKNDKTGMDTQTGQPVPNSSTSGNDSSHTTDNRRQEVGGVGTKPPAGTTASGNTNANSTTTAQGMTGADSVYQKSSQKSPK